MDKENLKNIVNFISEIKEEEDDEEHDLYKILRDILKSIIGSNIKSIEELWFENAQIKKDVHYHNLIISLLDILYQNLKDTKKIDIKKTAQELNKAISQSEFSSIYEQIRKIFFKVDPSEQYYYDVYCSMCFLGFKKESPLNRTLIDNLKELKEYDSIINSPFSKEILNFNYDVLDEEFLKNFNEFMDAIMKSSPDEKQITTLIEKLKNTEKSTIKIEKTLDKDSSESSCTADNFQKKANEETINISNNMNSPKKEDNNLNNIQDNTQENEDNDKNLNQNNKQNFDNNSLKEPNNSNKIKEAINENHNNDDNVNKKGEDLIKEVSHDNQTKNPKENINNNTPNIKLNDNMNNINMKNEKMEKQSSIQNQSNGERDESSNNEETEIASYKKYEKDFDNDTFEDFKKNNKMQVKENTDIETIILIHKKRMYRVNGIILLKSRIKQEMKEFCDISKSQTVLLNYFCSIQENLINITILKKIIKQINPPFIINIRRKFIDLIIFWIIKKNSIKFELSEKYSPKSNYLDQILEILQKQKKSDIITKKIAFVTKEKEKDTSIISFPMKIKDQLLNDLISFLNFYKNKCSQVIHLGKEGLKFYNLSELSTYNNSIDTYQIFQENANEKDYVDIKIKSGNEIIPENDSVINIKFAFKFLFDSNYSYQISDTSLMNDLKKVENEKKLTYDSTVDTISQSFNNMLKNLENSCNMPEYDLFDSDSFDQEEQECVSKALKDFDVKINSIGELIKGLKEKEKDISDYRNTVNSINKELDSLVDKECLLNNEYFYSLDQKEKGTSVLLYLQYKFMKLKSLYELISEACKNYLQFLDKNRSNIKEMILKIRAGSEMIKEKIIADNFVQSGRDIFLLWKKKYKRNSIFKYHFEEFINQMELALK